MKKAWLKYLYTGITTAALTGGAAFCVYRYQNGSRFTPRGEAPALQENRVVFDEENAGGKLGDASNTADDSALSEKDAAAGKRQEPMKNDNVARLFQLENLPDQLPDDAEIAGILSPTTLPASQAKKNGNARSAVIYETGDRSDSGAVLPRSEDGKTGHTMISGDNVGGSGSGGSVGGNGGAGDSSGTPGQTTNGTGNGSNVLQPEVNPEEPDPTPSPNRKPGKAETVSDPEPAGKPVPGINAFNEPIHYYDEETIAANDEDGLQALLYFTDETKYPERFYEGQCITEEMLYNAMTTEVVRTADFSSYAWGEKDLGRYVRIDAVSFDGGSSWETDFPLTIPQDTTAEMLVQVSYRFREAEAWKTYHSEESESGALTYTLAEGRVFVLSRALPEDAISIPEDSILNTNDEYPTVGETMSLYSLSCLGGVLAENDGLAGVSDAETLNNPRFDWYTGVRQTKLFSGWQEDDEAVGFDYLVTKGRHILEPGALTELDPKLEVRLKLYWLSCDEDGSWQVDFDSDDMYYMQTLCGFSDDDSEGYFTRTLRLLSDEMRGFSEALTVPEGIQLVDFDDTDDELEKLYADRVEIPASVRYIDTDSTGLRVEQGYTVAAENPYYSAEAGVLYDKEKTALLGVPYESESLTVPETVKKVQLSSENRLREVTLEAESAEMLPTLRVDRLQNCRIVLADRLLNDFAADYETALEETGNTLGIAGDADTSYHLTDGQLIRQDGQLRLALPRSQSTLTLSNEVTIVGSFALSQLPDDTDTLQLGSREDIQFAENALAGSPIQSILCQTEAQRSAVAKQLEKAGMPDISLSVAQTSREGYRYRLSDNAGGAVILMAPEQIETGEFDGTLTAADGTVLRVTAIGDGAFRGNESLRWVEIPNSVSYIGYGAFENCSNLEGVLIGAGWPTEEAFWKEWPDWGEWPGWPDEWEDWPEDPDEAEEITIGENALAGCDNLRFVASNVPKAHMVNDYDPAVYDFMADQSEFYVLPDAEGYSSSTFGFEDVSRYQILTFSDGSRVLYGLDADETPRLALRSGKTITALQLPESTEEIFAAAFSDTESGAGESYTVAFPEKGENFCIDEFAFAGASLGGVLTLPENDYEIADYAFQDTEVTSVYIGGRLQRLGDGAFYNCDALTSLSIACFDGASLPDGLLTDCENFRNFTIESGEVPPLLCYTGLAFQLNHALEAEAECESIILTLPEGTDPEAVVEKWRYGFAGGYTGGWFGTPYEEMWRDVYGELIDWDTWTLPSDAEVDAEVQARLLAAEQRIRRLIAADALSPASASDLLRDEASASDLPREVASTADLPREIKASDAALPRETRKTSASDIPDAEEEEWRQDFPEEDAAWDAEAEDAENLFRSTDSDIN